MRRHLPVNVMRSSYAATVLLLITVLFSCNPSRRILKDAAILEEGGLHSEALNTYSSAYSAYARPEAMVGMKRVGQHIMDAKMNKANLLCMSENFDAALNAYDDAIAFRNAYPTLELNTPRTPEAAQTECKISYIDILSRRAEEYMQGEDYENAHIYISKIFSLDRNNRKAQFLESMCEIMPNYKAGLIAMDKELWREAFIYFNEVCRIDAGFSDALKLREEARERGSFSIVYRVNDNKRIDNSTEDALAAVIKGRLLNAENPFIELLEREDLDQIILEQQETLAPEFDGDKGPQAGKLKRGNFLLTGELLSLEYDESPERISKCDCGAVFRIYSDKVNCYQYVSSSTIKATYKYKLLDAETGKLYKSDVLTFADSDTGAEYKYEIMQKLSLTSPTGLRDHDVDLRNAKVPDLNPLESEHEMLNRMNLFFADKIGKAIDDFKP